MIITSYDPPALKQSAINCLTPYERAQLKAVMDAFGGGSIELIQLDDDSFVLENGRMRSRE